MAFEGALSLTPGLRAPLRRGTTHAGVRLDILYAEGVHWCRVGGNQWAGSTGSTVANRAASGVDTGGAGVCRGPIPGQVLAPCGLGPGEEQESALCNDEEGDSTQKKIDASTRCNIAKNDSTIDFNLSDNQFMMR
jgi:hypothetical protein